jgi:hypothetical protein
VLSGTSLDAQTGLAPVSPLSVVSIWKNEVVSYCAGFIFDGAGLSFRGV